MQSKLEIQSILMQVLLSWAMFTALLKVLLDNLPTSLVKITKIPRDYKERHTSSSTDWNSLSSVERSMRIVPLPEVFRVRYGLSPMNITKHNSFRNCFKTANLER